MSDVLWFVVLIVISTLITWFLQTWRYTRCRCDRPMPWYIGSPHERHAILVARALILTTITIWSLWTLERGASVLAAILSVLHWYFVKIHGSGKRKWPKKMAGVVRVNQHGRLIVVNK